MHLKKTLVLFGMIIIVGAVLAACGGETTATEQPAATTEPETPIAASMPEMPYLSEWQRSGHADIDAEAFRHWDVEDPAEIPTSCAKCHSADGYQDFLGVDGSEAGKVDVAVPASNVQGVTCVACHNAGTISKTTVKFPSGVEITAGDDVRCMECHQGRESKVSVDAQIERFGITDMDAVVAPIKDDEGNDINFGFRNIHYYAAAATLYGGMVQGGYQYDGLTYDIKNDHVEGYNTCTGCHNPHTLEIKVEQCTICHDDVSSVDDMKNIRMVSSAKDYDGDGDANEGMYYEIEGLQNALYAEIKRYAAETTGTGIAYDSSAHPYWFVDADGDDAADQGDSGSIRYTSWTARLLKAAYNYQVSLKDKGAYAHGNKYIVQLLYDSISDLGGDVSMMSRDDAGHFAGNTTAFRYWDFNSDGKPVYEVPATCAKCHSASGLPEFIKHGANLSNPSSNGFACSTCHNEASWPDLYTVNSVTFPSGAVISFGIRDAEGNYAADDNNMCLLCHQGRSSKTTVDRALGNKDLDTVDPSIRFSNIHYFAAGATLFGADAQGAYMYAGKDYVGQNTHASETGTLNKCQNCHDVHALEPKLESCQTCHGVDDIADIRENDVDYDGDGNITEGVKGEIDTLVEVLYAQMQVYSQENGGEIVYNSARHPYFFNVDGQAYAAFTPRLLKAAYNYQYAKKDPGAYVHNPKFVIQFLIDSIEDLGGDVSGYTRP
ncbi:MAG: hypothetical protein QY328_01390 [Anaerolineales bacterium]|nr:MAG: hypothetical protein QY328_01390 [Anaerolineales bacterium]